MALNVKKVRACNISADDLRACFSSVKPFCSTNWQNVRVLNVPNDGAQPNWPTYRVNQQRDDKRRGNANGSGPAKHFVVKMIPEMVALYQCPKVTYRLALPHPVQ